MIEHLIHFNSWFPKHEAESAEQTFFSRFSQLSSDKVCVEQQSIVLPQTKPEDDPKQQEKVKLSQQLTELRQTIQKSRQANPATNKQSEQERISRMEQTQQRILEMIEDLKQRVLRLENNQPSSEPKSSSNETATKKDDDDDIDLFGSDDEQESEETKKRLAEYAAKKAKKEQVIAKSTIVLDVKPWDDETDLVAMEKAVRSIEADGLVWGQSKFLPVAFGVKKLQIGCVVEDDKIGTDFLEEKICEFEDYVQSIDIVSFNKI